MSNELTEVSDLSKGRFLIYQAEDGELKIDVRFEEDSVWLTQQQIAQLFQTSVPNVNMHISNIYEEEELTPEATIKKFLTVRTEGKREVKRLLDYYSLDMIISVGYRVKSRVATRFRIWATQQLSEFIKKGFLLDDERLKNPDQPFDYFEELERRIQDIRTSESRFYRKITDVYALSIDYDPTQGISINFFKTVQKKCTGLSLVRLQQRLSITELVQINLTWASPPIVELRSVSRMSVPLKTI